MLNFPSNQVVKNFKFIENYNSWKMYLQVKISISDIFTHMLPLHPHSLHGSCSHSSHSGSLVTPQAVMTWNIRLFMFYMICNLFKCEDFTVSWIKYLSYSMLVMLLASPLQPQSDTKFIPDIKATLMTVGFLLADSMLEVYREWEIKNW